MAGKNVYQHKWDMAILEQVAHACNLVSRSRTETDWEIFLTALYEVIAVLSEEQRIVLLLSQEVGLSFVDIARIMGRPLSTIVGLLRQAIDKVTFMIKAKGLAGDNKFDCKAITMIYREDAKTLAKELPNEPTDFEFLDRYNGVVYQTPNLLTDGEECSGTRRHKGRFG